MRKAATVLLYTSLFTLSLGVTGLRALEIPLRVKEFDGFTRRAEPVTAGVILPRSAVKESESLCLYSADGEPVPCQFETTATWPDGSVKWVLVDMLADCPARGQSVYLLKDSGRRPEGPSRLKTTRSPAGVTVETGPLRCTLGRENFDLFESVYLDHDRDGVFAPGELVSAPRSRPAIMLVDDRGREISSRWGRVESFELEAGGPVRATVAVKGSLGDSDGERRLDYTARIHFYEGTGFVRVFFTLQNYRPASPLLDEDNDLHWIMGREGSYFFEDMSLNCRLAFDGPIQLSVGDNYDDFLDRVVLTDRGGIYQESSGGEGWFHRVHMNHRQRIPLTFRGAKAFLGEVTTHRLDRPDAWLHVADRRFGLAVGVRHFWQNFPKALSADPDGTVRAALWPGEFPDSHELQGGEIKTHEVAFFFHTGPQTEGRRPTEYGVARVMCGFHHPLFVRAPTESYLESGFFDDAVAYDPQRFPTYELLMQGAVTKKDDNLMLDIEKSEEYGWRNFGDTPAHNEFDETGGPHTGRLAVSHFNHEYDHGYGMLFQSLRTASSDPGLSYQWWSLADPGIQHQSDIDFYHCFTDTLRGGVFNGGKFAHTAHGVEAVTSSHRSGGPPAIWWGKLNWRWGRGGSPESGHFDSRGLMAYYYLTGNRRVLESALEIADLVYFKITEDKFAQIDRVSRDAGNNIQILTDAYLLTWDDKYIAAVEKTIKSTAPDKQWYMSEQGRKNNPDNQLGGFWQASICINAVARWTAVMEEKTGRPYSLGREYVVAYADFISRFLAAGPGSGIYMRWSPAAGGQGNHGPWTYRVTDVLMFGHKYAEDPALKKRFLKAASDAFAFMQRRYPGSKPIYYDSKYHTILAGGGHQYTYFKRYGGWPPMAPSR